MTPLVYIVVLTWNGKKFIQDCLSSLLHSDYSNKKILVVDNNSSDGTDAYIRKNFSEVLLLQNKRNLGWAGGNNRGVTFALHNGAEAILVLNQDTKIDKKAITSMIQAL